MAERITGIGSDYRTARELIDALRARQVSAVELLEHSIARIHKYDAKVNAVVVRDFERARVAAAEADKALARGDQRPLLGLPITVKEAFNVAGLPTTWGIPGTQELPVNEDAVAVARLKSAGAVVIGKTNVPLMCSDWQSYNAVYGTTNNPWDVGRTPGGSSGGSAAALAAGYVSLELGSDIAGSVRTPAAYCGVFAHKPTLGVVPLRGQAPPGTPPISLAVKVDLAVVGPMARSASDLAAALDIIAGPDESDAAAYRLALPPARHSELRNFRILVLDQHPLLPTAERVRSAIERIASGLAKTGATVERTSPLLPNLAQAGRIYVKLLMSVITADSPDDVKRQMTEAAATLPPDDQSVSAMIIRGSAMSHADWIKTDRIRTWIAHQWRAFFREFDVVLCPVMATPALPHDHGDSKSRKITIDGRQVPYEDQFMWPGVATLAGLPATAMPIGLSAEGLPIGMQIIGPCLEDRTTIAFAELAEREFGGFVAPPGFI